MLKIHFRNQSAWLAAAFLFLSAAGCSTQSSPSPYRDNQILAGGWRFVRRDIPSGQDPKLDDSNWQNVSLPHTYNALDGQEGGNHYYRGPAWYRLHLHLGSEIIGRELYLRFEAASMTAAVCEWSYGR